MTAVRELNMCVCSSRVGSILEAQFMIGWGEQFDGYFQEVEERAQAGDEHGGAGCNTWSSAWEDDEGEAGDCWAQFGALDCAPVDPYAPLPPPRDYATPLASDEGGNEDSSYPHPTKTAVDRRAHDEEDAAAECPLAEQLAADNMEALRAALDACVIADVTPAGASSIRADPEMPEEKPSDPRAPESVSSAVNEPKIPDDNGNITESQVEAASCSAESDTSSPEAER
ncbi:unnamed protein product [Leptidea sinapis]|uniref:Uncharacterized protein n=1 Tax=Leptidea sinapis TaxID=189913 RepID=A0A5E4PPZ1_9NEOP|nr:unnamed protein product [Leptidea sinapis]